MYEYKCKIVRVVDGDTIDVDIDLGFGIWIHKERIRLMGIDTPESRTRDAEEKKAGLYAKSVVQAFLPVGSMQTLKTVSDKTGKFGRILGELFIGGGSYSINQQQIDECHAVPYFGQSKGDTEQGHLWNREALNAKGIIYEG